MKIPPRVCSFLWRLAHQCLPTRVNLTTRGIPCDDTCVMCESLAESHMHLFFVCTKAMDCWDRINLGNHIRELLHRANDFTTMLFDFLDRLPSYQQHAAAMLLWSLWKSRNIKLWDSLDTTTASTVSRAKDTLHEWRCMQRARPQPQNQDHIISWKKPPEGVLKCNIDAATFSHNTVTGFGMCFRNFKGQLLMGKSALLQSFGSVLEAEAVAMLDALHTAITAGYHDVMFETDNKILADAINSSFVYLNEFGSIVS